MVRRHDLCCKALLGQCLQDLGKVVVERERGEAVRCGRGCRCPQPKSILPPFSSVKIVFGVFFLASMGQEKIYISCFPCRQGWPRRGKQKLLIEKVSIKISVKKADSVGRGAFLGDFPGGPVVKTLPSNAGGAGSIPGRGAKIPHASGPKNQKT